MPGCDIVIVGAGIAGASLACQLSGQGCSVILLEREDRPGSHATGRSAAMFMESYGPPQVRALTRASRAFYEAPPPGFATTSILAPRGVLYVAAPEQQAALDAAWTTLAAADASVERLDAAAARALVACLRPQALGGAIFEPRARDIDVDLLLQGFLRKLRRAGGELRCGAEVLGARHDAGGWALSLAGGDELRAGIVVNAAGAWADEVAQRLGVAPLGLEPRRRSAFIFSAPAGVDSTAWPTVVGIEEDWYFKPDAGRLLGSPANADPTHAHDVQPEELDIAIGIHRIEQATTLTIRRPASTWAGLRTFAADGEIVVGWDDAAAGFFWLAGQGGYGIQSAAGTALLAASLLCAQPLPARLAAEGVDAAAVAPRRLRSLHRR